MNALSDWLKPIYLLWISGVIAVFGLIYASFIERFSLEVREVSVAMKRLPRSFAGLRIAFFSDVHLGLFYHPRHLSRVVEIVNESRADMVCLLGDLFASVFGKGHMESVVPVLSEVRASMGKFAVMGNHEHRIGVEGVARTLEESGFKVLQNDRIELRRGKDILFLIGLDDYLEGRPLLGTLIDGVPETAFRILLVHEPDCADVIMRYPVDLQLSGHSHGGQFRIPWRGPVVTTRMGRKYHSGLYQVNGLTLYTNRGVGTTFLPLRFLCRPEITIITLEPEGPGPRD